MENRTNGFKTGALQQFLFNIGSVRECQMFLIMYDRRFFLCHSRPFRQTDNHRKEYHICSECMVPDLQGL